MAVVGTRLFSPPSLSHSHKPLGTSRTKNYSRGDLFDEAELRSHATLWIHISDDCNSTEPLTPTTGTGGPLPRVTPSHRQKEWIKRDPPAVATVIPRPRHRGKRRFTRGAPALAQGNAMPLTTKGRQIPTPARCLDCLFTSPLLTGIAAWRR